MTTGDTVPPQAMGTRAADVRLSDIAVIIIGRNEGERLRRCLQSVAGQTATIIYVDSGSTDRSIALAREAGAEVIELDMSTPFTAARARNAGFAGLCTTNPPISYVQFIDGDCEIEDGWLAAARAALIAAPGVAAVLGRRRERFPDATIYNRLCDEEWSVPPGEVESCGGDVLMRAEAFRAEGGYRDDLIAGEEPELCVRLRQRGWKILCIAQPMTIHDAAMTRFSQWWRRSVRAGHAFAEGAYLHGASPQRHFVVQSRRVWLWGAGVPAAIAAATLVLGPAGLVLALVYPAQVTRLFLKRRGQSVVPFRSAAFLVLGNFPEVIGQVRFHANRLRGRTATLIEYK